MVANGAAKFSGGIAGTSLSNRYDVGAQNETSKLLVCQPLNVAVVMGRLFFLIIQFQSFKF
jgi:hypothetical protein